jgi:hypothetical protein
VTIGAVPIGAAMLAWKAAAVAVLSRTDAIAARTALAATSRPGRAGGADGGRVLLLATFSSRAR